ncbi:MAG: hypothetical protein ABIQ73_10405, partial [Acidimicrobiales bacterium]
MSTVAEGACAEVSARAGNAWYRSESPDTRISSPENGQAFVFGCHRRARALKAGARIGAYANSVSARNRV